MYRKVIGYVPRWDHTSVYSKHVCGGKLIIYQYFNVYPHFLPK